MTDSAVWALDQTPIDIRHKATVARSGQLAVTAIDDAEIGSAIASDICERPCRLGVAAFMDGLQTYPDEVAHALGGIQGQRSVTVLVTAYVAVRGGMHRYCRSHARPRLPLRYYRFGCQTYWSGSSFTA
ncbi:MAG: hypothetical protein EOP21_02295 [Hyphomicrobiales bacterium]|nr:MAG: hypothetical protein EOP21_02295 [Hyphomicrobiales bacterium]